MRFRTEDMVDSRLAREHLQLCHHRGMPLRAIARAAGVEDSLVRRLNITPGGKMFRVNSDAILSVPLPAEYPAVTSAGMMRRVYAAERNGWTRREMAAACDREHTWISRMVAGDPLRHIRFSPSVARFLELYETRYSRVRVGDPVRASEKWPTVEQWEGLDIDDPEAWPAGMPRASKPKGGRRAEDAEQVRTALRMLKRYPPEAVAESLGLSAATVIRWRKREAA